MHPHSVPSHGTHTPISAWAAGQPKAMSRATHAFPDASRPSILNLPLQAPIHAGNVSCATNVESRTASGVVLSQTNEPSSILRPLVSVQLFQS